MSERSFFLVTAIVFTVVALLHLARLAFGWSASVGGWNVPMWLSWVAAAVTAVLAYLGVRLYRKAK